MDLESECSVHESVEDDQVPVHPDRLPLDDHNEIVDNGSCASRTDVLKFDDSSANIVVKDGEGALPVNSLPPDSKQFSGELSSTPRGFGLKKWRRIRRDFVKDATATVIDNGKILKRGFTGPGNPCKLQIPSLGANHDSDSSVGSASVLNSVEAVDGFSFHGSNSDSRFALGAGFVAGTDSENSEDQGSKSSTAASAPMVRHDQPPVSGHVRWERNKLKTMVGKNLGISAQRVQQAKGKAESSKMPKEEKIKIKKENSHSSLESDSTSSNFVFMQGAALFSNVKQIGRAMSYNGKHRDETQVSEPLSSVEVETSYSKVKLRKVERLSQDNLPANVPWGVKEAKSKSNLFSDQDPLVESMLNLQSVQEALEKELQNFKEIGKDSKSLHGNSVDSNGILAGLTNQGNLESNSSDQLGTSSEAQVSSLRQYVKVLESKLEETSTTLEAKGSNISQLKKTIINCTKSTKEDLGSTVGLQEIKCRDIENEVECLFKQKIEAEVEYLAITRTVQNFKYIARKPTLLFEEQEAVAEQQAQMLNTLLETESKAVELEKRAKEMKNNYGDSVGTGEDLVTVGRLGKVAWCFVLQLLLLILVVRSFVSENLSHSRVLVIVPT